MKLIILSLSLIITLGLSAQITKKVCFLGNSYTYVNDMPGIIQSIATADGNTLIKDQNTPGGYTLEGHSTNATSLAKISSNSWDFVVLQDQSQRPSFPYSQVSVDVYPKAVILSDSIRSSNDCAIPLFFNTWGREVGDPQWDSINTFEKMNNRLFYAYDYMAQANNGKLAPVGIGFRHVKDFQSTVVAHADLYSSDGSHPSIYGSYLAACIFYYVIFDDSPLGNSFSPNGVTALEASYLQNVAIHVINSVDSVTIDYSNLNPTADFTFIENDLSINFTNTSINSTSYSWDFGDGNTSTDENPNHTYSTYGDYTVILTATSCGKVNQKSIDISIHTQSVDENTTDKFQIFPNPSSGKIKILSEYKQSKILIYNVQGKLIETLVPNSNQTILDLPKGLYFIKIGETIQKVVVTG